MQEQWIHESIVNKAVYFKSPEHKERFQAAIQHVGKFDDDLIDREYGTALYLLTADSGIWENASKYVSSSGIRFDLFLKKNVFSSGEATLIKLAANLFYSRVSTTKSKSIYVEPIELTSLDESNFILAIFAFKVRYYGIDLGRINHASMG